MFIIETEQEGDGRWIAEVPELTGMLAYSQTRDEAVRREHGEDLPQSDTGSRSWPDDAFFTGGKP